MPPARLTVRVQPGARRSEVVGLVEGVVRIRVAAQTQEGKANQALVELLSDLLDVPKNHVQILRGHASRDKVVGVEGLEQEEALRRLLAA